MAGRPLNVTDLDFGPDGNMFVITGGRKTQSALYRIRYVGPMKESPAATQQHRERSVFSSKARKLRRQLENLHGRSDEDARRFAWHHLASPDPLIRNAARVAIEHTQNDQWRDQAFAEPDPEIASTALLALARAASPGDRDALLEHLDNLDLGELTAYAKLSLIQSYRLILNDIASIASSAPETSKRRLLTWLESDLAKFAAPLGSGYSVRQELARLVADHHVPGTIVPLMRLLREAHDQRDRMNVLSMLCHQTDGWTIDDRTVFFDSLGELERTAFSGAGMPGRLKQIRERAVQNLTEKERFLLAELIEPVTLNQGSPKRVSRPFVKKWTLEQLTMARARNSKPANPARGEALFRDVLCASCHRLGGRGGVLGPDLTSLASRFKPNDILASIVAPSDVIAEKYRGTQIVTTDGRIISGQVVTGGDYRSSELKVATDPLDLTKVVVIAKKEIQQHRPSNTSPMPEGLLDTLTAEEVEDLLAFLTQKH